MRRTVFLLIGVALLLFLLSRLGTSDVLHLLAQVGWYAIPIVLLYVAHQVMRTLALRECVPRTSLLPLHDALEIRLAGEAVESLTLTGPLLAEPTKAWMLERHHGLTRMEGFAATLTEFLMCSLVSSAMAVAGLVYLVIYFQPPPLIAKVSMGIAAGITAFLIAAIYAIIRRIYLIGAILRGLAHIGLLRGRLKPDIVWINQMEDLLLSILHDRPSRTIAITLLEADAQAFLVIELIVVMHAIGVAIPVMEAFVIEAATKFTGAVFAFIPLQVGAAEGTYAVICSALGILPAAGFALAFVRRLRTLLIAAAGLMLLGRRR